MGFPFDVDGSQGNDSGPRGIPEGDYEFRVHETPIHSITSTKRNMLTMKMIVDDGEYSGKSIRFNLVFIPKNEPNHSMTVRALKAFGLQSDGSVNVEEQDFVDKVIRAHVRVKKEKYTPKGETEEVTVSKSEIGWFLDDNETAIPPVKASKPVTVPKDDDEVPF